MPTPPPDKPAPVDLSTVISPNLRIAGGESFRQGDVIDGKYQIEHVYGGSGKSGMGVVYIVSIGGRHIALKSVQLRYAKDHVIVERFLREARSWMLLGFHPHIVHAYRIDIIDAVPFLFLEYIAPDDQGAVSLADYLKYGPLPLEQAIRYGIQCADGMKRATTAIPHLVHRDLKPENLLVTRNDLLKVTDFGLVRTRFTSDATSASTSNVDDDMTAMSGGILGTPAYMAPEQFDAAQNAGVAADVYAFGCCFYEAIAGRRVFSVEGKSGLQAMVEYRERHLETTPTPIRELVPDCPPQLDALIMRCLEKDPAQRWPDWGALQEALLAFYEDQFGVRYSKVPAPEPSPMEIAVQVQSLTLLDGFRRAIQLRNLRERHDTSPYAFHIALASYFHCDDKTDEAQRQLERAIAIKGDHDGYEAVGRLAAYYTEYGRLKKAENLLDAYLAERPNGIERILESAVRLRIALKDFGGAEAILEPYQETARGRTLMAEILKASQRFEELDALMRAELAATVKTLRDSIQELGRGDTVTWARQGDADVLCDVLRAVDETFDPGPIAAVSHAYWPDLDGYPDFAASMSQLSWLYGELSELESVVPEAERKSFAKLAEQLDHPKRLEELLERDERWLWKHDD